ncbi:MAG: bis(5'-nucleosyl)-tetraphosphatase (symmetrical) YqeK [Oscillospiraceae bacterium]|nr:bis(5'-nucleosyl)-tetraphosphatase (symmetrical) YqeK [Oscillospiraceae bacterium]
MYSAEEIIDILDIRLSRKRYQHSLNVAEEAGRLAEHYNYPDTEKAYIAGLLHDICKELSKEEQFEMVSSSDMDVTDVELVTPPLFHAIAGAYYSEQVLHIRDEDILNAIRYHTVGRAGMSRLEEIIYIADLISEDRNYKDVNKMRKYAYQSIEKAMLEALKFSVADVVGKGSMIPRHTIEAYNHYIQIKKKKAEPSPIPLQALAVKGKI